MGHRLSDEDVDVLLGCLARGVGIRQTAIECGVARETVRRYARLAGHQSNALQAMLDQATPGVSNEQRAEIARERQRTAVERRQRRRLVRGTRRALRRPRAMAARERARERAVEAIDS